MSKFLTFSEAADLVGVHVKTLQKHARKGKLETVETPFGRRIPENGLRPYLEYIQLQPKGFQESDGAEGSPTESVGADWSFEEPAVGAVRSQSEPVGAQRSRQEPTEGAERSPMEPIGVNWSPEEPGRPEPPGADGSRLESNGAGWSRAESPPGADWSHVESSGAQWNVREPGDGVEWSHLEPNGADRSRSESGRAERSGVDGSQVEPDGARWSRMESSAGADRSHVESVGAPRSLLESVPLAAHLQALELAQTALQRATAAEAQIEEQRRRAELAERQRMALEVELGRYRLALEEQASSLLEARAQVVEVEARLDEVQTVAPVMSAAKKPGFWGGLRRFLGGEGAKEAG